MSDWLEAEQRVERAQQYSESERWPEALAELDAAIAINPHTALWHAQRGFVLEELDRPAEAAEAYEFSLGLDPDDREVALALGTVLARQNLFAKAVEVLEKLSKAHPDFEPAYCQRIHAYAELGQHDQAEQMFYLAQELDDQCPHCFYHMGGSLAARGLTERAIFCWNRVLKLEPNYIGINRRIAEVNRAQGRRDIAREYYLRELRDDPGNTDVLFDLAELAVESDEQEAAIAKFEQIVELDPRNLEARFALGKLFLGKGEQQKALSCFEAVAVLSGGQPSITEFDWRLGEALLACGRAHEAKPHLQAAVSNDPDNREILALLANVLLETGNASRAADCYRRLLAVDERSAVAHHKLARCLTLLGRNEAASDHCSRALELDPSDTEALLLGAGADASLGRWKPARLRLQKLSELDPNNLDAKKLSASLWRMRIRRFFNRS